MKAIEQVIETLHSALPGIKIEHLKTKFPGDDDGLWFVNHPDSDIEVNIESSTGELPFLIENSANSARVTTRDVEETVAAVCAALQMQPVNASDFEKYLAAVPPNPPMETDRID